MTRMKDINSYIPTDNLYKFTAIGGLLLYVFSLLMPIYLIGDILPEISQLKTEGDVLEIKVNRLRLNTNDLIKRAGLYDDKGDILSIDDLSDYDADNLKNKNDYYLNKINEIRNLLDEYKTELITQKNKNELLGDLNSKYRRMISILFFTGILGFVLMAVGFYLWYGKTQKPLDIILKNESEKI